MPVTFDAVIIRTSLNTGLAVVVENCDCGAPGCELLDVGVLRLDDGRVEFLSYFQYWPQENETLVEGVVRCVNL